MKMSDALQIEEGRYPWLPASNVTAGEVFDRHNVPRAGLLHQNGNTYYFECIIGDGEPVGIWAYALLDERELAELLSANGPDEFDAVSPGLIENRWVTLAIVADDLIMETAVLDAGTEGALGLAQRMLERWERQRQLHAAATQVIDTLPA